MFQYHCRLILNAINAILSVKRRIFNFSLLSSFLILVIVMITTFLKRTEKTNVLSKTYHTLGLRNFLYFLHSAQYIGKIT